MGVLGVGKTTIGERLADELGWDFVDADEFHPPDNVAKMARGEPLTDADRWPWLDALREEIDARIASNRPAVVACSALKRSYRRRLGTDRPGIVLVHLTAGRTAIAERVSGRQGHYAGADLLDSQLDALEAPEPDEALIVDAEAPLDQVVERVVGALSGRV